MFEESNVLGRQQYSGSLKRVMYCRDGSTVDV